MHTKCDWEERRKKAREDNNTKDYTKMIMLLVEFLRLLIVIFTKIALIFTSSTAIHDLRLQDCL
jgi:hypothetical protein